jgi:hypothetical protein
VNKISKLILNDTWFYASVIILLVILAGKFHLKSVELYIENKKCREVIKIQNIAIHEQNAYIIQSQKDRKRLMEIIERYNKLATRSRGDEA